MQPGTVKSILLRPLVENKRVKYGLIPVAVTHILRYKAWRLPDTTRDTVAIQQMFASMQPNPGSKGSAWVKVLEIFRTQF